jgi:histidinol phosphatase-like PHP family hydrolase
MDLVKALNSYFGMEVESVQDFKKDFKQEYFPDVQAENLLNFLLNLERQSNR